MGNYLHKYKLLLKNKRIFKNYIGNPRNKKIIRFFKKAHVKQHKDYGILLLKRLDLLTVLMKLAPSGSAAKQWIKHGIILVNGKKTTPDSTLKVGDIIHIDWSFKYLLNTIAKTNTIFSTLRHFSRKKRLLRRLFRTHKKVKPYIDVSQYNAIKPMPRIKKKRKFIIKKLKFKFKKMLDNLTKKSRNKRKLRFFEVDYRIFSAILLRNPNSREIPYTLKTLLLKKTSKLFKKRAYTLNTRFISITDLYHWYKKHI